MRFWKVAIVSMAALGTGLSASKPPPAQPFNGTWMNCETYQGASICAYKAMMQRGDRVCGVQGDFATNAFYVQRFVGTARGNVVQIDKICGDPGSETDTYCTGQAPSSAAKVGWGSSDRQLTLCRGRIHTGKKGDVSSCTRASARQGLPKVAAAKGEGPEPEDRAWMASCLKDEDR